DFQTEPRSPVFSMFSIFYIPSRIQPETDHTSLASGTPCEVILIHLGDNKTESSCGISPHQEESWRVGEMAGGANSLDPRWVAKEEAAWDYRSVPGGARYDQTGQGI